ncbi:U3 small nucleolar ribonucleoprotein MPP10 [Fasciola gigantica]|uniref:U3 small nucleolar ribonucleoprotein MPP10 n=1 Tax=Fasciola gigantica TaxID=46835 RepID=A0A504YPX7_FASGI|nr:U3 small nucleolar ribonucleoprotein MPP10 [Fasciola gigantica]
MRRQCENFEALQEQLDLETVRMEERMLDDKPWYMKGEIVAQDRAENTVLEEHLDVQRHGKFKPPPANESVILEFIKKSIKEQSFSSPSLKRKEQLHPKPQSAIIQDITQKSLVEDYENLFARSNVSLRTHGPSITEGLEKEQEDPTKNAIQREISDLFEKLDALSHLHFVPYKLFLSPGEAKPIANPQNQKHSTEIQCGGASLVLTPKLRFTSCD